MKIQQIVLVVHVPFDKNDFFLFIFLMSHNLKQIVEHLSTYNSTEFNQLLEQLTTDVHTPEQSLTLYLSKCLYNMKSRSTNTKSFAIEIIEFVRLWRHDNHIAHDLFPNEKVFQIIKSSIQIDSSNIDPDLLSEIQQLL